MKPNQEIELKFEIEGDELASSQLGRRLEERFGPGRSQRLVSTYFDTKDLTLREAGLSLRIRQGDGGLVQTLKARAGGHGGVFARGEWEQPVASDHPDLSLAPGPLDRLLHDATVKEDLNPAFQTVIERTTWDVQADGAAAELALDLGVVRTEDRCAPICELELELKAGDPARLMALAKSLEDMAALRLGVRSKGDRGYELLEKTDRAAVGAEPPALSPEMTAGQAFQAIARACLRHYMLNEPLVIRNREPEGLHQARVALRRLRSAFSLFKDAVRDAESDSLKDRLKAVVAPLGEARDLDVFFKGLEGRDDPGVTALRAQVRREIDTAYDRAVLAMTGADARRLMLDLSMWLEAGPWTAAPSGGPRDKAAPGFAADVLDKLRDKLKRRGRGLDRVSPEDRHEARILTKKLRYGTEFFGALYPDRKAHKRFREMSAALRALQNELGELNDIETAQTTAKRLAEGFAERNGGSRARQQLIFAAGFEAGFRQAGERGLLAAAADAYARFTEAKPFWR